MKILTMCQGGNVRSAALAWRLRYLHGHDPIACGWERNTPETIKMLCEWADMVVVMQTKFSQYIPMEFHHKLHVCDVGDDIWGHLWHPGLQAKIEKLGTNKLVTCPKCGSW